MALPSYDETVSGAPQEEKGKDTALPAYRYAKTLVAAARQGIEGKAKSDQGNWDKFLGRYNWVSPSSSAARQLAGWCFQGVVNWTFSTIETKMAMILGSQTEIYVDSWDDKSSYYDRLLVKSAVDHLLKSARFDDVKRDAYLSGSVTGVGISMWQYRPDPITGAMKLHLVPIKSGEFACDPSVDSITHPDCRYAVWSTDMDMSRVREIFTGKAKDVKPEVSNVQDDPKGVNYTLPGEMHDFSGPGQPANQDPRKNAATRKAKVHFVWVKDESLIEELHEVVVSEEEPGFLCTDCNLSYTADSLGGQFEECPTCGAPLESVTIPPKKRTDTVIRKAYPYGRLIVYSGDTLLYDDLNPYELEGVFPFGIYHHYRVPGEFRGANDVDLLDSLQDAQNRTVGQVLDSTRLSLNGVFIYPVSAKSFTSMGVAPAERHPLPDHLKWLPQFVSPNSTNLGLAQLALATIKEQYVVVSGLGGPTSEPGSPPISATEAEIANARLSDRMKGHAREFAAYCSDVAEIGRQLAKQFYDSEASVPVNFPDSTVKDVTVEWQSLPDVRVRVSISPQDSIKDKQVGQNVTIGIQNGILDSPYAELYLSLIGATPNQVRNIMDQRALAQELRGAAPGGGAPPPLSLIPGGGPGVDDAVPAP